MYNMTCYCITKS